MSWYDPPYIKFHPVSYTDLHWHPLWLPRICCPRNYPYSRGHIRTVWCRHIECIQILSLLCDIVLLWSCLMSRELVEQYSREGNTNSTNCREGESAEMSKFSFPLSGGSPSTLKFLTCNQQVIIILAIILYFYVVFNSHLVVGSGGPGACGSCGSAVESSQLTWSCFPQVSFFSLVPPPSSPPPSPSRAPFFNPASHWAMGAVCQALITVGGRRITIF